MTQQRRGRVPEYLKGKYQPEYKRLDVDPTSPGVAVKAGSIPERSFKVGPQRPPEKKVQRVPLPVHVGVHQDQTWFGDESAGKRLKIKASDHEIVDNNAFVDVERLQGQNPLEQEEVFEVEAPVSDNAEYYAQGPIQNNTVNYSTFDLYTIILHNQVVFSTSDESGLEAQLEDLMIQHGVQPKDIIVLKRIVVDFGVKLL